MLGPQPTGLGVYAERCAFSLARRFDLELIAGHGKLPEVPVCVQAPESVAIGGGKVAAIRRQLWMRQLGFDADTVVYSPTHHGLPMQSGQIITVHDLICLRFPAQHRPQYLFFRFGLPRLLRKCKAVFTVSETSRRDIAETYGFPEDRIFVVPNGVDRSLFKVQRSQVADRPYLLMVGARYPHKNIDEVLDRHAHWADRYELRITSCVGAYRKSLERKVQELGLTGRVHFLDYVSREQLIDLYQGSAALLYPSKWEGFGIPPLESLACGVPVIASDIPVHREVLGDAGIFVRLGDDASWAEGFSVLDMPERILLIKSAAGHMLEKWSWEHSADALQASILAVEPLLAGCLKEHMSGAQKAY